MTKAKWVVGKTYKFINKEAMEEFKAESTTNRRILEKVGMEEFTVLEADYNYDVTKIDIEINPNWTIFLAKERKLFVEVKKSNTEKPEPAPAPKEEKPVADIPLPTEQDAALYFYRLAKSLIDAGEMTTVVDGNFRTPRDIDALTAIWTKRAKSALHKRKATIRTLGAEIERTTNAYGDAEYQAVSLENALNSAKK